MSPMRVDPIQAFERTIATTEKFIQIAERLDLRELFRMMREDRTLEILKWLEEKVLA